MIDLRRYREEMAKIPGITAEQANRIRKTFPASHLQAPQPRRPTLSVVAALALVLP